ncbi:TPA: hypothetical protein P7L42_003282 [Vibrio cholerae]|uniref:hypothetical protein n=1 Tax=Vibrio cholerae TaxID=666 RepID=UPI0013C11C7E|nr:hypothetical protein [Vibrio cholerae]EGZ6889774.1 hypothetical protein [Vibrio cholerae]MCX9672137.1 hypothetical protein [Vibrio cholerae]MCX9680827.1 hypothetical protein [Vibrio cholerae]MCX9686800.1 hypothetical protein [Vibrio cholerae]MCX9698925.1 hypothetical protein [Vibrio cholerae]
MEKEQFIKVRDLLGMDNLTLGKELGYTHTKYQCKQIDNLASGSSAIKPVVVLALECLARRKSKLSEFKKILEDEK